MEKELKKLITVRAYKSVHEQIKALARGDGPKDLFIGRRETNEPAKAPAIDLKGSLNAGAVCVSVEEDNKRKSDLKALLEDLGRKEERIGQLEAVIEVLKNSTTSEREAMLVGQIQVLKDRVMDLEEAAG